MLMARKVALCLIAAAAIAVTVALRPSGPEIPEAYTGQAEAFTGNLTLPELRGTDYRDLLRSALSDFDANNRGASGAPQQQVVNGWVARDLLSLQVMLNDEMNANLGWLILAGNDQMLGFEAVSGQLAAVLDASERVSEQLVTVGKAAARSDERMPILVALALVAAAVWAVTEPKQRKASLAQEPMTAPPTTEETPSPLTGQ